MTWGPEDSTFLPISQGTNIDPRLPLIKNQLVIFPVIGINLSARVNMVGNSDARESPKMIAPHQATLDLPGNTRIKPSPINEPTRLANTSFSGL